MTNTAKKFVRDILTPFSKLRYNAWSFSRSRKTIKVDLQQGGTIEIRSRPATDKNTVYEMFVLDTYKKPNDVPDVSPSLIVDIGANVGYSVIYWATKYPQARIIAYEPHPVHLSMIYKNLEHNSLLKRVLVVAGGAGNCHSEACLTDEENESSLVSQETNSDLYQVKVFDIFEELKGKTIDILKMDIEGGEYEILSDDRFKDLDIKLITMEWHNTELHPDGFSWVKERLSSLGYKVVRGEITYPTAGMLWSYR